jgi:hypothetical protein
MVSEVAASAASGSACNNEGSSLLGSVRAPGTFGMMTNLITGGPCRRLDSLLSETAVCVEDDWLSDTHSYFIHFADGSVISVSVVETSRSVTFEVAA